MPSYRGVNIFGYAVSMVRAANPAVTQENHFFGLSGVESLSGGLQGRYTEVRGLLYGVTAADLNAAELLFESNVDGRIGDLEDQYGNVWPFVRLDQFQPQGRIVHDPRGFYRPYVARFLHLT
jgi:hypothetical protein